MTTARRARSPEDEDVALRALDAELAAIFAQHADFVWRVLRRLGTPAAEIEDALQEVFLVVARKLPEYDERGSMRAWLFTIAKQRASHARRSQLRRARRDRHCPTPDEGDDPHAALERSEAVRFVEAFLAQLDERQAIVFFLADIEGMTAPEIATSLQVGLNTVYSRLRLARERFEQALRRQAERSAP